MICTPFGFKKFEDIRVGDQVSNPDGSIARVIAVHDHGVRNDLYEVVFIDGASTVVASDHLWTMRNTKRPPKADRLMLTPGGEWEYTPYRNVTTAMLFDLVEQAKERSKTQTGQPSWPVIPLTKPVQFTVTSRYAGSRWPIDPYTLGVLLGDGCLTSIATLGITSADEEIASRIKNVWVCEEKTGCKSYRFEVAAKAVILEALEYLGLFGRNSSNKFVPQQYKVSPLDVRWELIRGLMDTDGTADSRGHASFTSISKQLALDVQWIARSLGFKATITDKVPFYRNADGEKVDGQLAYTVEIIGDNRAELFHLTRKKERCRDGYNGGHEVGRRVVDVRKLDESTPCRCITVDHPNGLYVTDDFIVTHNSDALLMGALQWVDVPGYAAILFRRTFQDLALPGALMDRAKSWLIGTDAAWNEQRKTWTFPSSATLSFGYLEHENDKYRYQGAEFQYVGFDEVTQFVETQYTYLFSRLRRLAGSPVPLRMRSAGNPPTTSGGMWVKDRFVINRSPIHPFIPSGLNDNPYLDKAEYLESLDHLDDATRKSLFDWFASVEGLVFADFNEGNLTDEEPNPLQPTLLAIDDGYFPDPRATLFVQNKGSYLLVFDELYQYRTLEESTVEDITEKYDNWELPKPKAAAVSHEAPALRDRLSKANIPAYSWLQTQSSEGSTRVAAIKLTRSMIKDAKGHRGIRVHRRCKHLIKEITQGYRYPEGKHRPDDRPADGDDHACEALESLVWMLYSGRGKGSKGSKEY